MRGQANLLAIPVALLVVTAAAAVGLGVAADALADADRTPVRQGIAETLAEEMVAPGGPVAVRQNVLSQRALDAFTAATFRARFPGFSDRDVRIHVDGQTVVETGAPDRGTTVRRLVHVEERGNATLVPSDPNATIDLPDPTPAATVRIDPPNGTTVETLRVGDRVVRHNRSGIGTVHRLDLPATDQVSIRIDSRGDRSLSAGNVTVEYAPTTTRTATLVVTVGA